MNENTLLQTTILEREEQQKRAFALIPLEQVRENNKEEELEEAEDGYV